MEAHNTTINWPEKFEPKNCPVFVSNEISINASAEQVWAKLIQVTTWPQWYFNASAIEVTNQHSKLLLAGTRFNWKTFGAKLSTEISEYVPDERLAWTAKGTGILAYHAWLIVPTPAGCTVITQETQHGWLCRLGKLLFPDRMYKYHQIWLQGLKAEAEKLNQ